MEKNEINEFVQKMKARDHAILLYTKPEDKHQVLFTYLKAGLEKGEAAAYVAGQETPEQIRQAMQKFSIDVERNEKNGALKVIDYRDWYITDGKFNMMKTIESWTRLLDESKAKGFKGLRITGETACFFKHNLVKQLAEYEQALHRTLEMPLTAICAYDSEVLVKEGDADLLINLLTAYSTAIIMGPKAGLVKTVTANPREHAENPPKNCEAPLMRGGGSRG